jgi:hypothetical protein
MVSLQKGGSRRWGHTLQGPTASMAAAESPQRRSTAPSCRAPTYYGTANGRTVRLFQAHGPRRCNGRHGRVQPRALWRRPHGVPAARRGRSSAWSMAPRPVLPLLSILRTPADAAWGPIGLVHINEAGDSSAELPFGAIKHSGVGRALGRYGIDEFVNRKPVRIGGLARPRRQLRVPHERELSARTWPGYNGDAWWRRTRGHAHGGRGCPRIRHTLSSAHRRKQAHRIDPHLPRGIAMT